MLIEYRNGKRQEMKDARAKYLIRIKRATEVVDTYQTRDMADQPKVMKLPEVDSAGNAWDESIHVASRLQNKDGTWRKKPGAAAAQESVE